MELQQYMTEVEVLSGERMRYEHFFLQRKSRDPGFPMPHEIGFVTLGGLRFYYREVMSRDTLTTYVRWGRNIFFFLIILIEVWFDMLLNLNATGLIELQLREKQAIDEGLEEIVKMCFPLVPGERRDPLMKMAWLFGGHLLITILCNFIGTMKWGDVSLAPKQLKDVRETMIGFIGGRAEPVDDGWIRAFQSGIGMFKSGGMPQVVNFVNDPTGTILGGVGNILGGLFNSTPAPASSGSSSGTGVDTSVKNEPPKTPATPDKYHYKG
jgi:hypothetical protein